MREISAPSSPSFHFSLLRFFTSPYISRRKEYEPRRNASFPVLYGFFPSQILCFQADEKIGGLEWGAKISAIKGLEKIQDAEGKDGIVEYRREKEDLKFGQATLSSIHYAFWLDQLYMLTIRTQGSSNYTALRGEVFRQFGKGLRADQPFERYLWTEAPNDMMLQYSKDGEQGLLWLRSSEIDRQYKLSQVSGHASYLKWMKSRN